LPIELTKPIETLSNKEISVRTFYLAECDLYSLQHLNQNDFPFLLESVAILQQQKQQTTNDLSQYSILFAYPQEELVLNSVNDGTKFKRKFEQDFKQNKQAIKTELPFSGGWFCYFSYDYAQVVEPSLSLPKSELPLAILSRIPCALCYDNIAKKLHLVAEKQFEYYLPEMEAILQKLPPPPIKPKFKKIIEENEDKYLSGIKQIKEYILSGDIFQVNLSRQWQVEIANKDASSIYQSLRQTNPAPFAANIYFKNMQIISSSPERLVKYDAKTGWVETRPIAGTRKRSDCLEEDKALINELISHPKEIAEHVMLIDLERNDLGRICEVGTVEVNELMSVETYKHVHHIVSNIRGKLKKATSPLDIIHAVFPGGTITGCPKIRCMEIIAELEKMPRDAYTGSVGYINHDGSMDTNILIRTIMLHNNVATFRAGAGIVADSVAEDELEEARHKAKGLIQSLV